MRRVLLATLIPALLALPLAAQMRGSRPAGGLRGSFGHPGIARGGPHVRGGFAFGRNPRVGVFIGSRPFFRHRHFFARPFFPTPVAVWPYPAYYGGYSYEFDDSSSSRAEYDRARLSAEVDTLRQEVDRLRQQQDVQRYLDERQRQQATQPRPAPAPERQAPPAIFALRNGQQVEAQNYAIVGSTLWILSEQRARKIPTAELDVAKTTRLNEERGIELHLPSKTPLK